MTQPRDPYLVALREDWPSRRDEARVRRRLIGAGLGVSVVFLPKTVAASSSLFKTGLLSSLASRFMSLSLVSQFSVVTAATTVAITVPVWFAEESSGAPSPARHVQTGAAPTYIQRPAPPAAIQQAAPNSATALTLVPTSIGMNTSGVVAKQTVTTASEAPKPARGSSSLAEETRLLDAALSAIRAGELTRAARLLDEHEVRFEPAKLGRERQSARKKLEEARRKQRNE